MARLMTTTDELPIDVGDLVGGKYRVEKLLGAGGMGVVVSARHVDLEHLVAIKVMRREAARRAQLVARFLREARAASRLRSEHVARVTDMGKLRGGVPYMVMEHLEGRDLGDVCTDRKWLPVDETAEYLLQACEAIAEAHAGGIVHRDIKPQ